MANGKRRMANDKQRTANGERQTTIAFYPLSFAIRRLPFAILSLLLLLAPSLTAQTFEERIDSFYSCLDRTHLDSAEFILKDLLRQSPDNPLNPMLLSNLGSVQRMQGKYDDALLSYTAALGHAPRSITLLTARAELFTETDKPENALTDYTSVLLIDEMNEDALYRRGLLYLRVKNPEAARADFERILELNSNTLNGRIGMASLCKINGNYDEAETIYFYLIDKHPDHPDLYAGRAELYILMNRTGKAMADINRAIRLQGEDPPNPYFYLIRSRIKEMQFEKKGAAEDEAKARKYLVVP